MAIAAVLVTISISLKSVPVSFFDDRILFTQKLSLSLSRALSVDLACALPIVYGFKCSLCPVICFNEAEYCKLELQEAPLPTTTITTTTNSMEKCSEYKYPMLL